MVSKNDLYSYMIFIIAKLNGMNNKDAAKKMRKNYWHTQLMAWKVWPIACFINYSFMPIRYRVFFLNMVGFFWAIVF